MIPAIVAPSKRQEAKPEVAALKIQRFFLGLTKLN